MFTHVLRVVRFIYRTVASYGCLNRYSIVVPLATHPHREGRNFSPLETKTNTS